MASLSRATNVAANNRAKDDLNLTNSTTLERPNADEHEPQRLLSGRNAGHAKARSSLGPKRNSDTLEIVRKTNNSRVCCNPLNYEGCKGSNSPRWYKHSDAHICTSCYAKSRQRRPETKATARKPHSSKNNKVKESRTTEKGAETQVQSSQALISSGKASKKREHPDQITKTPKKQKTSHSENSERNEEGQLETQQAGLNTDSVFDESATFTEYDDENEDEYVDAAPQKEQTTRKAKLLRRRVNGEGEGEVSRGNLNIKKANTKRARVEDDDATADFEPRKRQKQRQRDPTNDDVSYSGNPGDHTNVASFKGYAQPNESVNKMDFHKNQGISGEARGLEFTEIQAMNERSQDAATDPSQKPALRSTLSPEYVTEWESGASAEECVDRGYILEEAAPDTSVLASDTEHVSTVALSMVDYFFKLHGLKITSSYFPARLTDPEPDLKGLFESVFGEDWLHRMTVLDQQGVLDASTTLIALVMAFVKNEIWLRDLPWTSQNQYMDAWPPALMAKFKRLFRLHATDETRLRMLNCKVYQEYLFDERFQNSEKYTGHIKDLSTRLAAVIWPQMQAYIQRIDLEPKQTRLNGITEQGRAAMEPYLRNIVREAVKLKINVIVSPNHFEMIHFDSQTPEHSSELMVHFPKRECNYRKLSGKETLVAFTVEPGWRATYAGRHPDKVPIIKPARVVLTKRWMNNHELLLSQDPNYRSFG